jgi:glutamine synthetase
MSTKEILQTAEACDLKIFRLYFRDVSGRLKWIEMPTNLLPLAIKEGIRVDASDVEGLFSICDREYKIMLNPETAQRMTKNECSSMLCFEGIPVPDANLAKTLDEIITDESKRFFEDKLNDDFASYLFQGSEVKPLIMR